MKKLFLLSILIIFSSCVFSQNRCGHEQLENSLLLTFCGDIMAHTPNYSMKNYDAIYDNVRPILLKDDLTFGNLEMPVCNSLPLSTYPKFNVHTPYLQAAVDGGFDVFSLANNHANDHGVTGIKGTITSVRNVTALSNRPLYFSGLRQEKNDNFTFAVIQHKDWKIIFLSVTQILNMHDYSKKFVHYIDPSKKGREKLYSLISTIREQNPCDLFILGIHIAEKEYGTSVLPKKRQFFLELGKSGADIIWAHHPHVMQPWEVYAPPIKNSVDADIISEYLFMYSMGNFISSQRYKYNFSNPSHPRENTGDAIMLQVRCRKIRHSGTLRFDVTPIIITNTHTPDGIIVTPLTESWIATQSKKFKDYYSERLKKMNAIIHTSQQNKDYIRP